MPIEPSQFPRADLAAKIANATVQVVLGFRSSATKWTFQRLPMQQELQEEFRKHAEAAAVELRDERTGREYDPEWDLKSHEFSYVANSPAVGGNFFAKIEGFADLPEYRPGVRAKKPRVWVIVAQLDDGTIAHFGTGITSSAVLDRAKKLHRLVYSGEVFVGLDATVLTLRPQTDWIVWKDVMVVLNATKFHALFRDVPALVERVDDQLAEISQHVQIDGLKEMADRIKSFPAMAVKLSRIIDRGDMHTRSPDVLREYGQEYSIEVEWNGDRMVFDSSMERQWNILRLLDEAHTLGPVTGKHWDSASKVEV
jgi:hypothetical protein